LRRLKRQVLVVSLAMLMVVSLLATGCGSGTETTTLSQDDLVEPITIYAATADYDPIRNEFAYLIADEWKKLGFDVKVEALEWNRLNELVTNQQDFDVATIRWAGRAERIDPDHFVFITLHSSQTDPGQYNETGYSSPEYDAVAELQRTTLDPELRREHVFEAQEIATYEQPYSPVVHRRNLEAYNSADWGNVTTMMGEGINSFWNFMSMEPKTERTTYHWGYYSEVATLNPMAANASHDLITLRLIYDRLVRIGPDGKPQLWAAEELNIIDNTTIDVKIREGMKFHDGEPVTADDVKFSFDYMVEAQARYFMGLLKPVESVTVLDQLTVRFKLKEPFAAFIANTLGQVFILPEHIWSEVDPATAVEFQNNEPVGSGPFAFEYWRRDEEMKLTANKDHFNPANMDAIIKLPFASLQGLVMAFESGTVDNALNLEPLTADRLAGKDGVTVVNIEDHGFYYLPYNVRKLPFSDMNVRRALAYAIPKQTIIDALLEGNGTPAYSVIGPMNEYWHNPDVEQILYDLDKAREILEDAGYRWDDNGRIYYPETQ